MAVLCAAPVEAQIVKTITIQPFNWQNNRTEPETIDQIRAKFAHWQGFLDNATNGLMRLDVTVNPYVTLPIDKPPMEPLTGSGTAPACSPNGTTGTSWDSSVLTAAKAAGYPTTFRFWIYSPQTFGWCSEFDRVGRMVDGRNFGFLFANGVLGLTTWYMPAWTTICTDPATGAYAPLTSSCRIDNRTFQSLTGQGGGAFTCAERMALGTMPAARVRYVTATDTLPITVEIVPIEQVPTGDQIQCLTIRDYNIPTMTGLVNAGVWTVSGITFELHKWTEWSRDWQVAGLSGHIEGRSMLLDVGSPDGRVVWPGQAGTSTLNPGQNFTMNNVRTTVVGVTPSGGMTVTVDLAGGTSTPVPQSPGKVTVQ